MSIRTKAKGEEGAAAVEFALIVGLLAILIFGLLEYGIAFWQVQNLRAAAREGARVAAVRGDTADISQAMVGSSAGSLGSGFVGFSASRVCDQANEGLPVTITINNGALAPSVQRGLQRVDPVPSGDHVGSRTQRNVPMRVNDWIRSRLRLRRDDGATAVIVVLTLVALLGVIVLTVDVGQLLYKRRAMVNASDAAALAAAQSCAGLADSDSPTAMANTFAANNVSVGQSAGSSRSPAATDPPSATSPSSTECSRDSSSPGCSDSTVRRRSPPRPRPGGGRPAGPTRSRSWSTRARSRATATSRRELLPGTPCYMWYDNDLFNNSAFGFLNLCTATDLVPAGVGRRPDRRLPERRGEPPRGLDRGELDRRPERGRCHRSPTSVG